jgi:ABC-type nickel/cobalt efflux system permease component RcnA
MKEKLFKNVNAKLKKAAFFLAVGGLLLVTALGVYALYTTWQYSEYYGYGMPYMATTLITYVALGFCVIVGAWMLYSFAELAENTQKIKHAFCDESENCEDYKETESASTEEDK